MNGSLAEEISELLRKRLNVVVPAVDADLISIGLLDSLTLVELFLLLEEQFGVRVDLEDITLDDFRSVSSIVAFVARKRGGGA